MFVQKHFVPLRTLGFKSIVEALSQCFYLKYLHDIWCLPSTALHSFYPQYSFCPRRLKQQSLLDHLMCFHSN